MKCWRLIQDGRYPAALNMAADAWLLGWVSQPDVPPVLRIYGWREPSITIGYHQQPERAINIADLHDTPVARRITGGRALLHDDNEITYAVAGNFMNHTELGSNLSDSYWRISTAIVEFYHRLGLDAAMSHRPDSIRLSSGGDLQKGCFASVSRYEVIVNGRKMAAGSQRRIHDAFMQHGAVRIRPPARHPAILDAEDQNEIPFPAIDVARSELERRFVISFMDVFGVKLDPVPFSASEREAITARISGYDIFPKSSRFI